MKLTVQVRTATAREDNMGGEYLANEPIVCADGYWLRRYTPLARFRTCLAKQRLRLLARFAALRDRLLSGGVKLRESCFQALEALGVVVSFSGRHGTPEEFDIATLLRCVTFNNWGKPSVKTDRRDIRTAYVLLK